MIDWHADDPHRLRQPVAPRLMPRSTAISLKLSQNSFSRLTLVVAILIERFVVRFETSSTFSANVPTVLLYSSQRSLASNNENPALPWSMVRKYQSPHPR
jgi:hypothetical protein